ncbi:MAG TPA: hypothetical protein VGI21_04230 [Streptosporangiaceae bacterium]
MGYRFTLLLNREVTDEESGALQEAGCSEAVFSADKLPTNADVTVTKMEFDDTASPTLAEAIESALEAVKKVPDLSVPGLTVPAQPAEPVKDTDGAAVVAGEVVAEDAAGEAPAEEIPAGDNAAEGGEPAAGQTPDAVGAAAESS